MKEMLMYERIKIRGCSFLLNLYKWMQDRPLFVSFLLSSSCILFSFLLVFIGDKIPAPFTLTYYDTKGHIRLYLFGYIISALCIFWTFLLQASEKYYHYKMDEESSSAEAINYIRERVDTRIINVCNNKYNTLISLIPEVISGKEPPRYIISRPCEQLKTITKEMAACLRSLLMHGGYSLNENDIYVSIFYKFQTTDRWGQTHLAFPEIGLSVSDVVANKDSTFSHTLKSKNGILFINNKQDGYDNNQYVPDKDDKYDKNGNLKGSILCYRIICKKNGIDYITAVLSISTYDKRIEPSNLLDRVNNIEDNICKYIIKAFEKRIMIELCLLYLSELYNSKRKKSHVIKSPEIQSEKVKNKL